MALTITTNTYSGIYVQDFYRNAIFNAGSLKRISILPNAKTTVKLPSLNLSGSILQADSASWSSSGSVVMNEKAITPINKKINLEFPINQLESTFLSQYFKAGANNNELSAATESFIMNLIKDSTGSSIEGDFWTGTVGGSALFDGILVQAAADSGPKVTATGSAIDASNVIAEVAKVYALIPSAILAQRNGNKPAVQIYVDYTIAKAYMQAIANKSNEAYVVGEKPLDYLGVELVIAPLGAKKMFASTEENLWLVCDLFDDTNVIDIIDMRKTTGDDVLRFKSRFKMNGSYRIAAETVLYA